MKLRWQRTSPCIRQQLHPSICRLKKCPQEIIENEKEIARSQIQGKPANIVEKIVEGKVNAYFDANTLMRQKYIRDDSQSINDLIAKRAKEIGKPLAITHFIRWVVGQ